MSEASGGDESRSAEANGAEGQDTEASSTEAKGTEANGTEANGPEIRGTEDGEARRGEAGGALTSTVSRRVAALTVGVCLVLGVAVGVAWWALAPRGRVVPQQGYLFAVDKPELLAGQDSVFALLTAAAGLLVGGWIALRPSPAPVARVCAAVLGSGLGAVVAWKVGNLLGPPHVAARPRATPHAVPAPLDLHAWGVLVTWPAFTAAVAFVALLVGSLLGFRRGEPG